MNLQTDQHLEQGKIGRIRNEVADGSKIGAREHEGIHGEYFEGSKVETR